MSDLIDRQTAIDATWFEPSYTDPLNVLTEVRDRLKDLPSVQSETNCSEIPNNSDTISRQAAIDAVLDRMDIEKHGRNAKPEEIRWTLEKLPPAEPRLIRCRDCKYSIDEYNDGDCYCKRPSRELVWIGKSWDFFCQAGRRKT